MNGRLTRSECRKIVEELVHTPLGEDIEESCFSLPEAFRETAKWHEAKPPMMDIPGFSHLCDKLGGGISERGFTVITGPTGAGKTVMVANWFCAMSRHYNGYVVPIEIGPRAWIDTCLSIVAGKVRRSITAKDYSEAARDKAYMQFFGNKGNILAKHENRLHHIDYLAEVYYHWKTRNIRFAIGDNWDFMMEPATGKDAIAMNDRAMHDMITFHKKVPVHTFMIFHPRKPGGHGSERVESLYDIKGSSTNIQEATNVLIFNRLENENQAPFVDSTDATDIEDLYGRKKQVRKNFEFCREVMISKARWNGRARGSKILYSIDDRTELYQEHGEMKK